MAIFSSAGALSQMPVTQSCCSLARYRRDEKTQRGRATKKSVYKYCHRPALSIPLSYRLRVPFPSELNRALDPSTREGMFHKGNYELSA